MAGADPTVLDALLARPDLWRAGEHRLREKTGGLPALPSGHAALDAELPGGGWPLGALVELLTDHQGIGELRLLLPALTRLTREGRKLVFTAPPYLPYAPALAGAGLDLTELVLLRPSGPRECLWALEQTLRSGACGAVLGWPKAIDDRSLRRLQLAAEQGRALGLLFRPAEAARRPSPAALRLRLEPAPQGLMVHLLKRRGGASRRPVVVEG